MCQIENDAIRTLVFDLVKGVRVTVQTAGKIGGARIGYLLRRLFEIVDPHPEMNKAAIAFIETRDFAFIFQKRYVDGAVRYVAADSRFADALHRRHPRKILPPFPDQKRIEGYDEAERSWVSPFDLGIRICRPPGAVKRAMRSIVP